MPLQSAPQFIMVRCPCGRTLRARWEQVGESIECWDCHTMVPVAITRERSRLLGMMARSVGDLLRGPGGSRILLGAAALTLTLLVPRLGLVLAGLLMTAGGLLYAELIRRDDLGASGQDAAVLRALLRPSPGRLALGLGLALGTIVPLWLLGTGVGRSPHLNGLGLALFALTWSVGPLAAIFQAPPPVSDELPTPEGPGARLAPLRLHPLATLGVLLIVPLGLAASEAALGGLLYLSRSLSLVVLDYMPRSADLFYYRGYAFKGSLNYNDLPNARFLADYGRGLRQGYTFIGAIPPSFALPSRLGVQTDNTLWNPTLYFLIRVGATLLTCLSLILSGVIQARCLNVLAHARRRHLV